MSNRKVPSLVSMAQRVACNHVESISSFGDELALGRFDLIAPILESCSPAILCRFEDNEPNIALNTAELWKDKCVRAYPLQGERYLLGERAEPVCWRGEFFALEEEEARRIDELGAKMKARRLEAESLKASKSVKMTDKPPPNLTTRARSAAPITQTLFQKTRVGASKLQQSMYSARSVPPMINPTKTYRVLPSVNPQLLPPVDPTSTRVKVKTVYRRPAAPNATPSGSRPVMSRIRPPPPLLKVKPLAPAPATQTPGGSKESASPQRSQPPTRVDDRPDGRPVRPLAKKAPSSGLFMPKKLPKPPPRSLPMR